MSGECDKCGKNSVEIKRCPFCGNDDIQLDFTHFSKRGTVFFMECEDCECRGPWLHFDSLCEDDEKKKQCIEVWNKRN